MPTLFLQNPYFHLRLHAIETLEIERITFIRGS